MCLLGESPTHHIKQMTLLKVLAGATALLGTSFVVISPVQAFFGTNPLVGSWKCKTSYRDNEVTMIMENENIFYRNNTFLDTGAITFSHKDLDFPVEYTYYSTGRWKSIRGNIVEVKSSKTNVTNITTVPGASYQQNVAIKSEIDKVVPLQQFLKDSSEQGYYLEYRLSNNNNRSESVIEGTRDWSNASICERI